MGLSHLPLCCESVLGVQVESVQGNQAYLEWLGKSGSFPIEVCLLGCTRVSRLDQPPLEGQQQHRESFPFFLVAGSTGFHSRLSWRHRPPLVVREEAGIPLELK